MAPPKKPVKTTLSKAEIAEVANINSVAANINRMNMDTRRDINRSSANIGSMGSSYKYIDQAGYNDRSVKEVTSSVTKILSKFSMTIDTLSRGVIKITSATARSTKDAIAQYSRAISQDVSFNKQNMVAMALSQSTPIFGYFAAKFMETDVFRNAAERMKQNIGRALSGIGQYIRYGWERFKSAITFEEFRARRRRKKQGLNESDDYFDSPSNASIRAKNIPKLQSGGLISKGGVVYVHAGEVVSPISKLFKKGKYSTEQLLNSKVSLDKGGWLSKIYNTLFSLKLAMTGMGLDLKSHLIKYVMQNPFFRKVATGLHVLDSVFNKIPKFLFKVRNRYERELPHSTNVQENMANILAITYVRSMERYDQMIFYLRRLSEKITGEDVAPPGNQTYTNYQRIRAVASAIGLGGMFGWIANKFRRGKYGQIGGGQKLLTGGAGYIDAEYIDVAKNSTMDKRLKKIQDATEGTKEGVHTMYKKGKGFFSDLGLMIMALYSGVKGFLGGIPFLGPIFKAGFWGGEKIFKLLKFFKWTIPLAMGKMAWSGAKFLGKGLWGGAKGLWNNKGAIARGGLKGAGILGIVDSLMNAFAGEGKSNEWFGGKATGAQKSFSTLGGYLGGGDYGQSKGGFHGFLGKMEGAFFGAMRGMVIGMLAPPFGPPVGALIGGIFGYIGPERIAKSLNGMWEGIESIAMRAMKVIQHPVDTIEDVVQSTFSFLSKRSMKIEGAVIGASLGAVATGGNPMGILGGAIIGWKGGEWLSQFSKLFPEVNIGNGAVPNNMRPAPNAPASKNPAARTGKKGWSIDDLGFGKTFDFKNWGVNGSDLVKAVIQAESGGNPNATSSRGAQGLMQLMPPTARQLGVTNAYDPVQNVRGGTKFLLYLLNKYHGNLDKALGYYNGGGRGASHPVKETRQYIEKVKKYYNAFSKKELVDMHVAKESLQIDAMKNSNEKFQAAAMGNLTTLGNNLVVSTNNVASSIKNINTTNNSGQHQNPFDAELHNVAHGNLF